MDKTMPCGHDISEVVSSEEGTSYCGACERKAGDLKVNSIGTCNRCGYYGPILGHVCKPTIGNDSTG
ncbi:MAG: hypothetical protein BA863_10355 [Desulfovibrio sp. S3730MH75]|nr:MAG: hypothetical protein BA863_10355 [Desulfovibrio sp. S3730MH75]